MEVVEAYTQERIPAPEATEIKNRIRQITACAWDDMRGIVDDLTTAPSPVIRFVELEARIGTLENQVIVGGPETMKHRVEGVVEEVRKLKRSHGGGIRDYDPHSIS